MDGTPANVAAVRPHGPILVVEDNRETSEGLRHVLEIKGYPTVIVPNGAEALRYLRQGGPASLIVLDLFMPVMDGWAFAAALHADPVLARIPIIAYSAGVNVDLPGAAVCLRKSVDPEVLLAMIDRYLVEARP